MGPLILSAITDARLDCLNEATSSACCQFGLVPKDFPCWRIVSYLWLLKICLSVFLSYGLCFKFVLPMWNIKLSRFFFYQSDYRNSAMKIFLLISVSSFEKTRLIFKLSYIWHCNDFHFLASWWMEIHFIGHTSTIKGHTQFQTFCFFSCGYCTNSMSPRYLKLTTHINTGNDRKSFFSPATICVFSSLTWERSA